MHIYSEYIPVRTRDDELDVVSVLHSGLSSDPQRCLMAFEGEVWTVGRMAARVAHLQGVLAERGIGPGDRVALMLGNTPSHIALIYALILSGAVWIPINTKLKSMAIGYLLGHSAPKLTIVDPELLAEVVGAHLGNTGKEIIASTGLPAEIGGCGLPTRYPAKPQRPLCVIYTSGTTGAPKGVVFTHRMMRLASEAARIVAGIDDGDRVFLWEPLCHIGGAQMLLLPFLVQARLLAVSRFSARRFWSQIEQGACTHLHYLGGILDILMALPKDADPGAHTLKVIWGAGASSSARAAVGQRLGVELFECYGMTEGASFATYNRSGKPGSIGQALPWLTIELLDEQDQMVEAGELGQVVVSSDISGNFMPGYLDNPEATSQILRKGKLYTGDMARADADGDLYFVGRRTDSMRVRGENVSAWEVERVFLRHPDIAAAAAVGVRSDVGEQEILLYVQWRDVAVPFLELAAWAVDMLATYQVPRYYSSIDRFELTPSERIRKHTLSKDISGAWDRQSATSPST